MKTREMLQLPHILAAKDDEGVGVEIQECTDEEAMMMVGAVIMAVVQHTEDGISREVVLEELRRLLDRADEWKNTQNLFTEMEDDDESDEADDC